MFSTIFETMYETVKWKVIEWLVEHRVLAVARCRAQQTRGPVRRRR